MRLIFLPLHRGSGHSMLFNGADLLRLPAQEAQKFIQAAPSRHI